jgi:uncharacterized protein (TIGR02757 family)
MLNYSHLREFLDPLVYKFNRPEFIEKDPVQIPHLFSKKEDIEISAFLTSILSWGQRPVIISKARLLMQLMDNEPYNFIKYSGHHELQQFNHFVHRTFQSNDCIYFIHTLKELYSRSNSLENIFYQGYQKQKNIADAIVQFREVFYSFSPPDHVLKHLPNIQKNASAKRMNMFLRWMIRKDNCGVDFGIWDSILPCSLMIPLDIHSSNSARKLGLLSRKSIDWKAVEEVTAHLRKLDPVDPVKYDFALFSYDSTL